MKKLLLAIPAILMFCAVSSAQTWIPARVAQVKNEAITGVRAQGLINSRLRIHGLGAIDPVVGEEFYLLQRGECLSAFTEEEQDKERFIRQPVSIDCSTGGVLVRNVQKRRVRSM